MLWCLKWQILVRNNGILHGDFPDLLDYLRTDFSYVELPLRFPRKVPNEIIFYFHSKSWFQFSSEAQSCPTLCDPMNRSTPGLPVHHQLPEFTQTHVHRVGDATQPSNSLLSLSPPDFNISQYQGIFQWIRSLHQGGQSIGVSASASVLPMNI